MKALFRYVCGLFALHAMGVDVQMGLDAACLGVGGYRSSR